MKKLASILFALILLSSCNEGEKMRREIAQLEESTEKNGSPATRHSLADAYYLYANRFPADSLSENWLARACALFADLGAYDSSLIAASEFLSRYGNSAQYSQVELLMARSYYLSGHSDSAIRVYERVREQPSLSGDDLHLMKKVYLDLIAKKPKDPASVDYRIKAGNLLAEAGAGEQAISLLLEVADSFPESRFCPYALMRAADVAETRLGDLVRAESLLRRLIETYPESNFASDAHIILEKKLLGLSDEEKFARIVPNS